MKTFKHGDRSFRYDVPLVYIAGKITASTPIEISCNVAKGCRAAEKLINHGKLGVILPHLSAHLNAQNVFKGTAGWDYWMPVDLTYIAKCDVIYMLPGWEDSKGASIEHAFAKSIKLPIFYDLDMLMRWADNE